MSKKMKICKICGDEIARSAKTCPRCGARNKKSGVMKFLPLVIIVILVIALIAALSADSEPPADNNDGHLNESYEDSVKDKDTATDETTEKAPDTETTDTTVTASGEVSYEFKAAMDSYEAFFDEYCEFMKKYEADPGDVTLLSRYADFMTRYADMMTKLNSIDEDALSKADALYYAESVARIEKKLAEVAIALS